MRLAEALQDTSAHRCWLDEQPGANPLISVLAEAARDACALLIGPEGGWTDTERTEFSRAGWIGASLGPNILRAETAACAALAVVAQVRAAKGDA
jgi:16S rRNA (uracil1498-N3)-methyltransferase